MARTNATSDQGADRRPSAFARDATPEPNRRGSIEAYIRANLALAPVPIVPELSIYTAHSRSGLSRRKHRSAATPYWAYPWAGGIALARHILDHPDVVGQRRVLDLGTGSGLVAIAAARAGAGTVIAADMDLDATIAAHLNAQANQTAVDILHADITSGPLPDVDLVLAGDVFYEAGVAARVKEFLARCRAAGIAVLVGDPGREFLPRSHLRPLQSYPIPDFGAAAGGGTMGCVFEFTAPAQATTICA
jgi:predicted nicotinamide N-methyase